MLFFELEDLVGLCITSRAKGLVGSCASLDGVYDEIVPLRAASMEKGRADPGVPGGLILLNGVRLLLFLADSSVRF